MNRLDALLQPGESVLWQRDQRVRAGPVWPYLVAALPVAVLGVIVTVILWHVEAPGGIMVLVGLMLLFPASMAFLVWADEWLPKAIAVTDSRILRAGSRAAAREELARAEVLRADMFVASGAINLHLAAGGIRTLNLSDDAEGFARALDVPARIWRRSPQPVAPLPTRLARHAMFAVVAVAVAVAGPQLAKIAVEYVMGDRLPGAFETALFVVGTLALCAVAIHALYLASHRLAVRLLPADEARRYRCWYLDRRCRGLREHPETGGPAWAHLNKWYTDMIARQAFGGNQDCDCGPEIIGPDVRDG